MNQPQDGGRELSILMEVPWLDKTMGRGEPRGNMNTVAPETRSESLLGGQGFGLNRPTASEAVRCLRSRLASVKEHVETT